MRSGTCRMLKLSTNAFVSFLIYAVKIVNEKRAQLIANNMWNE